MKGVTLQQRRVFSAVFAVVAGASVIVFITLQLGGAAGSGQTSGERWTAFEAHTDITDLRECLGSDDDARVLVMGDDEFAARAGALGSLRAMMEPRNMAENRLDRDGKAAFFDAWQVDYVLVRSEDRAQDVRQLQGFVPVGGCELMLFEKQNKGELRRQ